MAEPLLVYLDSSALQRPLDALLTTQEVAEADCVVWILDRCRDARVAVLEWSDVLEFECIANMPRGRLEWARIARELAVHTTPITGKVERRARVIAAAVRPSAADALHVACAEEAQAALVTVDHRLLRRCHRHSSQIRVRVHEPIAAVASLLQRAEDP